MQFLALSILILSSSLGFAQNCPWRGRTLEDLRFDKQYEVEWAVSMPMPPKVLEVLEKYFGKFSKEKCQNSIEITKIQSLKTQEKYIAFYTHQYLCDGGNTYGVIFKESDSDYKRPSATIEDAYLDCL